MSTSRFKLILIPSTQHVLSCCLISPLNNQGLSIYKIYLGWHKMMENNNFFMYTKYEVLRKISCVTDVNVFYIFIQLTYLNTYSVFSTKSLKRSHKKFSSTKKSTLWDLITILNKVVWFIYLSFLKNRTFVEGKTIIQNVKKQIHLYLKEYTLNNNINEHNTCLHPITSIHV